MKPTTIAVLRRTYQQLQYLADELYTEFQSALDNNDFLDASLLEAMANKIFEEAESLDTLISELEV
ncbi:hypothetical protein [Nostoc sp.]|uniref:hypothetical protein n=1 Tax=Nostoc sp. TaxID=1180 RepID=UPI002FFC7377